MTKTYIVVGAGFRGFCDALQLLSKPDTNVIIIDSAPFFGGISYSAQLKGFMVDKGVHMFDSVPQSLADIVTEIMDGKVSTIDFVSVSAFNNKMTDGFSLPDLNSLDDASVKNRITEELKVLAANSGSKRTPHTLTELFEDRYGKTAAGIFSDIFRHVYNVDASAAQPDAISKTSLGRLKHLDDDAMRALKASSPFLDSVLAARRLAIGKVDDLVSIYPTAGDAMRGWCERAVPWLEAKGATIRLGESIERIAEENGKAVLYTDKGRIEADNIIWTNDNIDALAKVMGFEYSVRQYISGTPMIFATLVTKASDIKNFTYLQNFDPSGITYRTASAGIYSEQTDANGNSFVTCECPTPIDSERWNNADSYAQPIFEECKRLGIVTENATLADSHILRLPTTFKVAKLGYDEKVAEFGAEVTSRNPRVIFRDVKPFFRRDIYLDAPNVLNLVAA